VWRRDLFRLLTSGTFAAAIEARAQPARVPVVGLLSSRSPQDAAYLVSQFESGLYEAGFDATRRIRVEARWAEGHYDRLPKLASELVGRRVDVLAAVGGEPSVVAAKQAVGTTTPFVFIAGRDPVELGLVESLRHPGGNATGVVIHTLVLGPKRLDLLRQVTPNTKVFGALINSKFPESPFAKRDLEEAASSLGLGIVFAYASSASQLKPAFVTLVTQGASALVISPDPFFDMARHQIVALAAELRLPAIYHHREYAIDGGLMSYGIDLRAVYRTLGSYAGKIVMGAPPASLPVQRLDKIEFVINLRTARSLGLQVPDALIGFADEVIE